MVHAPLPQACSRITALADSSGTIDSQTSPTTAAWTSSSSHPSCWICWSAAPNRRSLTIDSGDWAKPSAVINHRSEQRHRWAPSERHGAPNRHSFSGFVTHADVRLCASLRRMRPVLRWVYPQGSCRSIASSPAFSAMSRQASSKLTVRRMVSTSSNEVAAATASTSSSFASAIDIISAR